MSFFAVKRRAFCAFYTSAMKSTIKMTMKMLKKNIRIISKLLSFLNTNLTYFLFLLIFSLLQRHSLGLMRKRLPHFFLHNKVFIFQLNILLSIPEYKEM